MARLRRNSSESITSRDDIRLPHTSISQDGQLVAAQQVEVRHTNATRSSPRKKLAKADRLSTGSQDGELLEPQRLVPKAVPTEKPRSRQIRLAPIATTKQNAKLFFDLPLPPSKIRRNTADLLSPAKTKPVAASHSVSPLLPASAVNDVVDEEADIEESVWCGSDEIADSSEDELPSPSKFMLAPKTRGTTAAAESDGLYLTNGLGALRISESPPLVLPKVLSRRTADSSYSRPASSSDKENIDQATLRYSPPRLHSPRKQRTPERATTPPVSPSKGRLLSPSKRAARIPIPTLRPSLDAFWNAEVVNDWQDQYSPRKEWKSPSKLKLTSEDPSASPTTSPRKAQSPIKRTKAEIVAKKDWEARKHHIAEDFLAELDQTVTNGRVGEMAKSTGGVRFVWSKTLTSTAGRANWRRETTKTRQVDGTTTVMHKHHASIELAEKVIDDEDRLLNVIAHEFCHLCNFMVSGIKDQPHGRQFKEWGRMCTSAFRDRGIEVTTKHTYQIEYKYIWRCSNEECAAEFKRHSKSIDLKRHTCGNCRSQLVQIKPVPRQGAGGNVTGYAAYVKQHFATIKAGMPKRSHKEIMEAVGQQYRGEKAALASSGGRLNMSDKHNDQVSATEDVDEVARVLEFITIDDD